MGFNKFELNYKKIIFFSLLVFFVLLAYMSITKINGSQSSVFFESTPAKNIIINDKDNTLYNSTTPKDYMAFQDRLRDFITYTDGDISTSVNIKSVDVPFRDGSTTTVIVDIPSLKISGLKIFFDYDTNTFSIPSQNYTVPLYGAVYN